MVYSVALAFFATISAVIVPLIVPRLLIEEWGRSGLALFLMSQSWVGLVGLADFGLQAYVGREAVGQTAQGKFARAKAYIFSAERFLKISVFITLSLLALYMFLSYEIPLELKEALPYFDIRKLVIIQLLVAAVLNLAGASSSLREVTSGKDRGATIFSLVQQAGQVLSLIVCAITDTSLLTALIFYALMPLSVAFLRLKNANRLFKQKMGSAPPDPIKFSDFFSRLIDSSGIVLGQILHTSGAAAVFSSRDPTLATLALPARTLGSMSGKFPTLLTNLIWPSLTRTGASLSGKSKGQYFYSIYLLMSGLQLLAVSGLGLLGNTIFALWLPSLYNDFQPILPFLVLEQSALAVAAPLQLLLFVSGSHRPITVAWFISGLVSVIALSGVNTLSSVSLTTITSFSLLFIQIPLFLYSLTRKTMSGFGFKLLASAAPPLFLGVVIRVGSAEMVNFYSIVIGVFALGILGFGKKSLNSLPR